MKTLKVKDSIGQPVQGWSFGTFKAFNVGNGKARKISGWQIRSNDGYLRCCEGNWDQFVSFARIVIANYGFTSSLS